MVALSTFLRIKSHAIDFAYLLIKLKYFPYFLKLLRIDFKEIKL